MIWKITCYNGDFWIAPYNMLLTEAVEMFCKELQTVQINIKSVENLH